MFQESRGNQSESLKKRNIFGTKSNPSIKANNINYNNDLINDTVDIENNMGNESTPLL